MADINNRILQGKVADLDFEGREIPDSTPIVLHIKGKRTTDFDAIRAFIRGELSSQMSKTQGAETFEEANDFDVDNDLFPVSKHEYDEDTEAADYEALKAGDPRKKSKKKGDAPPSPPQDQSAVLAPSPPSGSRAKPATPPAGAPPGSYDGDVD